ncbi:MAG: hypothetical protein GAK35_02378 [Herbaspirillum frisingense]|uniref:Phage head closure protein n=1 Tax=Herbaspirillum frisingense TaxID=92645 RepID=A0A7V8JU34_9BURK|nr:MAG: hypothetical protein GAK35_02378 [Herbaspirillum frisingense]
MLTNGMRHLVEIQYSQSAKNTDGDVETTWVTLATVYAERKDLSGQLLVAAQALFAEAQVQFRIRFRPGIKAGMRVAHGSEMFRIGASIDRTGRRVELFLICGGGLLDVGDVE